MSRALFDSNIVIDFLSGLPAARDELARSNQPSISVITWIEVMAGTPPDREAAVRTALAGFHRIELSADIAARAATIRRERRIKLPDAIIQATSEAEALPLVTRNERDFPQNMPGIRIPYRV
jgi:predicted nucleic acid-binding protein